MISPDRLSVRRQTEKDGREGEWQNSSHEIDHLQDENESSANKEQTAKRGKGEWKKQFPRTKRGERGKRVSHTIDHDQLLGEDSLNREITLIIDSKGGIVIPQEDFGH